MENGQSYFQTNTATELNETEKKLQRYIYENSPQQLVFQIDVIESWLTDHLHKIQNSTYFYSCFSILYNHLPEETKSWLKQQRQV